MKFFQLGFGPDYCIRKQITVDVNKCKKKSDLTPIINSELNIKNVKFSIDDQKLGDLSKLNDGYVFKIKFDLPQKNIYFQNQNEKKIDIKDASEKNVFEVIKYLPKEKSDKKIYLNYTFYINGIEIPKENEKPFSNLPPGAIINFKLNSDSISLEHEGKEYIFCENEKKEYVENYFKDLYKIDTLNVIIFNGHHINKDSLLCKGDSINSMSFYQIVSNDETSDDSYFCMQILLEISETITQLKMKIANIFSETKGITLNEKDIILEQNGKQLNDPTKKVRDINDFISFKIIDAKPKKKEKNKEDKKEDLPKEKTKPTKEEFNKKEKDGKNKKQEKDGGNEKQEKYRENKKQEKDGGNKKQEKYRENKKQEKDGGNEKQEKYRENKKQEKDGGNKKQEKDGGNKKQEKDRGNEKQEKKKTARIKITPKISNLELTIHFLFESSDKKELQYKFSPDTTIKEIASKIATENKIEDKIEIKYKENNEKVEVDPDMTLNDIKDDMKIEANGKTRYVLYINIKPKTVKPSNVKKSVKPKIQKPANDKDEDIKVEKSKETDFTFECQENKKKLKIKSDTTLKENEQEIRNLFGLDKRVKIQYRTSIDDDSGGELIEDENSKIDKFKGKTIKIQCFTKKPSNYDELLPGKIVYKYFYQTNKDMINVFEVELESNAIVKSMKKIIASENDIKNLNDIKILFAGKDLLNDLVLKDLNIGTTILFVYIRSQEDILLMTAKALVVNADIESEDDDSD